MSTRLMRCSATISALGRVLGLVGEIGGRRRHDEARGRRRVARQPVQARALAHAGVCHLADLHRLGIDGRQVHVVAQVLDVPLVGRRVGQHADGVVVDVHLPADVFDDDALSVRIVDDVVQRRERAELRHRLAPYDDIADRGAHLLDGREVAEHPGAEAGVGKCPAFVTRLHILVLASLPADRGRRSRGPSHSARRSPPAYRRHSSPRSRISTSN